MPRNQKPDRASRERLGQALQARRWDDVRAMMAAGAEVRKLRNAVHWAVVGRSWDMVVLLLDAGADPNGGPALMPAVGAGWKEAVELLLDRGADPGRGTTFDSPLSTAIDRGFDSIAALLVRRNAPLMGLRDERPLLVDAVFRGLTETVGAMLDRGADPDVRGTWPRNVIPQAVLYANAPAIVVAAGEGHEQIFEMLVSAGADLSAHDDSRRTAHVAAVQQGHGSLADRIVALGGAAEARLSPEEELFVAMERRDAVGVGRLLAGGVSPDTSDPRAAYAGRTPLMTAILSGDQALFESVLAAGPHLDRRDSDERRSLAVLGLTRPNELARSHYPRGMTALMVAATLGRTPAIRALVAAGASVDLLDDTRSSALMLAAGNGHAEAVEALLAAGADPNLRGFHRTTALLCAAGDDHASIVKRLLAAGADPTVRDGNGDTALDMARTLCNEAMLEMLEQASAQAKPRRAQRRPNVQRPGAPSKIDVSRYDPEAARARCRANAGDALLSVGNQIAARLGVVLQDRRDEIGAVELHVPSTIAIDFVSLQDEACGGGGFLFSMEDVGGQPGRLAILPTTDPLEAVTAVGVAGPNHDVTTGDVVAWLSSLPVPWRITRIEHNTLAGRFLAPLADPAALAEEIYRLCPDVVDQGTGDVESLATELETRGGFFLWWD